MADPAPLYEDVADGPPDGKAWWVRAADGVRIRVGMWAPSEAAHGTLILCPGRTEFIEKYGHIAKAMADHGYATLVIDWRGQGLADRLLEDRRIGHVEKFTDFQLDLAAAADLARKMNLPRPWHILGHSMGGAIALRAVMEGFAAKSCVFTGPMWGIYMAGVLRPVGWALAYAAPALGLGGKLPPTTALDNYVAINPFEGNVLTRDADMYRRMQRQIEAHPELALGGPSLTWLREALFEARALSRRPSPDLPCLTFLGAEEKIIDTQRVHQRMAVWPNGELHVIPNAEHEVLVEVPETRNRILSAMVDLFDRTGQGNAPAMAG